MSVIKQQLVFLEAAFKLVENVELPDMGERFSIDIVDFYTAVDSHNEDLRALHRLVVEEMQWFENWADYIYENESWFDGEDEKGDELLYQIFRQYDDVSEIGRASCRERENS